MRKILSKIRGHAKQLVAEIVGDQPLQEDGICDVRAAAGVDPAPGAEPIDQAVQIEPRPNVKGRG